jgi:hypothetical protein
LLNYDADAAFPSLDYLLPVYLDIVDQTVMPLFELHQRSAAHPDLYGKINSIPGLTAPAGYSGTRADLPHGLKSV